MWSIGAKYQNPKFKWAEIKNHAFHDNYGITAVSVQVTYNDISIKSTMHSVGKYQQTGSLRKAKNIRQTSMLYMIWQKSARAAVATNNILT